MKDMKDYRERELPLFIVANMLLFLTAHDIIKIDVKDIADSAKILSEIFVSSVFSIIAYGVIVMVECLFTSGLKEKLVYPLGLSSLPGYTIFSDIKKHNRDNRFSYTELAEKYATIYKDLPAEKAARRSYENEQWYKIYARHRDVPMIRTSQRDSLLCRDMYISTLALLGMYIAILALRVVSFYKPYFLFLLLVSIITNLGANRKAVRFAYNVIAYDIAESAKGEKIS